jgi:predicted transcriptional regulator of viral defense system
MTDQGFLVRIAHGIYADPNHIPGNHYSSIEAQKAVPNGVLCLLSALSFHEIGTQNPSVVWMAIPRANRLPSIKFLPVNLVRYSETSYSNGIEKRDVDGVKINVYSIPKTVADCFKFRNRIGLDVAIEALKDVLYNRLAAPDQILKASRICRVESVVTPYLESLL